MKIKHKFTALGAVAALALAWVPPLAASAERAPDWTPEARVLIDRLAIAPAHGISIAEQRAAMPRGPVLGVVEPVHRIEEHQVQVGGHSVPVRLYRPSGDVLLPVLVWLHSGSWVKGDLNLEDNALRAIANRSGWAVLAVGYRLAPEHPYPAALEDVRAVLQVLPSQGTLWGLDATRVVLGGNSAGANLAAATALNATGAVTTELQGLVLLQPLLDLTLDSPSWRELGPRNYVIGTRETAFNVQQYLGANARVDDPRVSPLLAPSVAGLPRTYLAAAGVDPARDDATAFAARLVSADVTHELHVVPGVPHGFFLLADAIPQGQAERERVAGWLRALPAP